MNTDQIHIRGLQLVAPHGVYDEERQEGRRFTVDMDVWTPIEGAGTHDELKETIDYCVLSQVIMDVLQGPSKFLIESLATQIVHQVFQTVPTIQRVRVTVWKRALGVPGDPERVGVTMERDR